MKTISSPQGFLAGRPETDESTHAQSPSEDQEESMVLLHEMLMKELEARAHHPLIMAWGYHTREIERHEPRSAR